MSEKNSGHCWKFHRLGGLEQVVLQTADDLVRLSELDSKLWAALSCPAAGLELNSRALELIDSDRDGRIREPEVLAAVKWACERLTDPASLIDPPELFYLDFINQDTDDGRRLAAAGREMLKDMGRDESEGLSDAEVIAAAAVAAQRLYNGDGVLPADSALGPEVESFINDGLALMGGATGLDGRPGLTGELAEQFWAALEELQKWRQSLGGDACPFGDDTAEAWKLMGELRDKIDDFFLRCDLAAFSPSAAAALDPEFTPGMVNLDNLDQLPLARVAPDQTLSPATGFNPLWKDRMSRLLQLTTPFPSGSEVLTREGWGEIQKTFDRYAAALAAKPAPAATGADQPPSASFDDLSDTRLAELLSAPVRLAFTRALELDRTSPESSADVADLERLVLYHRHLYRFLLNFVSFHDFYLLERRAVFQAGELYFDGRNCKLCLLVDDPEQHSALAAHSYLCLLYCLCRRVKKPGEDGPEGTRTIVAALTAGSVSFVMEGRHGVFIDNEGYDWDATIIKYIPNNIDLWQAVWSPYRRIAALVGEQLTKMASQKQESVISAAGQKISAAPAAPPAGTAPAQPFDIGRSVGIFAAIGLALGAIGTAVASLARAVFALSWWQLPLIFLALFVIISGASVFLAWLRLRKRTLGPLLDASGWAVNAWAPINLVLGHKLTDKAALPPNATRLRQDPLAPPKRRWPMVVLLLIFMAIGAAVGWIMYVEGEKAIDRATGGSIAPAAPAAATDPAAADAPGEPAPDAHSQ